MTHTSLRRLGLVQLAAIGVLAVSIGALAYFSIAAHSALCTFKSDLEQRLAANKALLEEDGPIITAYGLRVPRGVLETNVRSQEATVESLDQLHC